VFAAALIKKRKYWPKYIDGNGIIEHFANKPIGHVDAKKGVLDGVPFTIFGMKEEKYVLMMMSTYGTPRRIGKNTGRNIMVNRTRQNIKFQYPEVVANHYRYRHAVDDHNARRHAPISLESTWKTTAWSHRVFAFIIAISEVNTLLWIKHKDKHRELKDYSVLSFRKQLSYDLIYNKYYEFEQQSGELQLSSRLQAAAEHRLCTIPAYHKITIEGEIVESVQRYHQVKCSTKGCNSRVRTYCECSRHVLRCAECYAAHVATAKIEPPLSALD
jgi:Transposase IS4